MFLGDFWQLRPTGQISLMSSPFAQKAMENAKARQIMNMFWDPGISFSLQEWSNKSRMMHLDVNERSGQDVWFSEILDHCREGALTEDDYNFLHGYPTKKPVEFWYHQRAVNGGHHTLPLCKYEPYCIHQYWQQWPGEFECQNCWQERKRRYHRTFRMSRFFGDHDVSEVPGTPDVFRCLVFPGYHDSIIIFEVGPHL